MARPWEAGQRVWGGQAGHLLWAPPALSLQFRTSPTSCRPFNSLLSPLLGASDPGAALALPPPLQEVPSPMFLHVDQLKGSLFPAWTPLIRPPRGSPDAEVGGQPTPVQGRAMIVEERPRGQERAEGQQRISSGGASGISRKRQPGWDFCHLGDP